VGIVRRRRDPRRLRRAAVTAAHHGAGGRQGCSRRAPAAVRASVDVFAPEDSAMGALTKRVKESFDPKGLLNPGRMWAGV